jgi:hypothetical protein
MRDGHRLGGSSARDLKGFRRVCLALATAAAVASACTPVAANDPGGADLKPSPGSMRSGAPEPRPPSTYVAEGTRSGVAGCPLYPRNNVFHADIRSLPVRPDSDETIEAAGADRPLGSGFYAGVWQGSRPGIPINVVDSRTLPLSDVIGGTYGYMSDLEDHPIPADPAVEGHPGIAWDRHMVLLDTATCVSSEFWYVTPPNPFFDRWMANTAVKLDMTSNDIRDRGSATASGMSMLALMVRYEEVASGRIDHMLEVALPDISSSAPRWPASRTDGVSTDPHAPPMGTVFRLRADADLSALGPQARTIAGALQKHGAVLGDSGPGFGIRGENDGRWQDADLATLKTLQMSDFEAVDVTPMKVRDGSYEIR